MNNTGVFDLSCRVCSEEIIGLEFDCLFSCRHCADLVDPITERRFAVSEVVVDEPASCLRLPIWALKPKLTWTPTRRASAAVSAAKTIAGKIETVYVVGFALAREEHFGDLGLAWTRRQDKLSLRPPVTDRSFCLPGVRRSAATAEAFVLPYLMRMVDDISDITHLEFEAAIVETRLLSVPFIDSGHELVDPFSGLRFPRAVFDELDAMRELAATVTR